LNGRRRAGVIVLVACAILIILIGLFLTGRFPQEPLRRAIESRLQQGLGAGSSVGSVRIVPGRLQIELRDLVIVGPTYKLVLPRAYVVAKMDFVLGRSLAFRVVQAESPHLVLRPSPTASPKKPLLSQPLIIDRIEMTDGVIEYEGTEDVGELVLRGVDARGSIGLGTLEIALDGGTWRRGAPLELGPGHGLLRVSSDLDITIDALDTRTARSTLHTSGRLGVLGMLAPDLQIDARLDLRDAEPFQPGHDLAGTLNVKGRLKYTDRFVLDAEVDGQRLRFDGRGVDRVTGSVKHGVSGSDRTQLDLRAALLGGQASLDAAVRDMRAAGRARFSGIDIERLRREGLDFGAPLRGQAAGTVAGEADLRRRTVDLDWQVTADVTPAQRMGAGALRFHSAHVEAEGSAAGTLPPAIEARFDGSALMDSASGRERMPFSGTLGYRGATLTADVQATGLGGSLRAALETRGAVVRRLEATLRTINLASLVRDASGLVDADVRAHGPWKALSGTGTALAHDLVWRDVQVGEASARFAARGGVAEVSFAAPVFNATGSGTATARGFKGTVLLADTSLETLRPLLSPNRPLSGVVSGTVNVDLPWGAPERAVIVAHLDRAEAASGTFEARALRPFTITLRGRRAEVAGLLVQGPGMDFAADGSVSLDPSGPLDLQLRGQADLSRVPPPSGWTLQGVATGDVRVTGTRTQPRVNGLIALRDGLLQRPGAPPIRVAGGEILLEGDVAIARNLRVNMASSNLELTGRIPLTAVLGEDLAGRLGLSESVPTEIVAHLDIDLADLPLPPPYAATGRLRGDAVLSGTRTHPRASGELVLRDALLLRAGVPMASVADGHVLLAEDAVEVPGFDAIVAEGTATLSGRVPLAALLGETRAERFHLAAGEASLRLQWRDIEVASLYETVRPDRLSPLEGTLAGEASVEGQFTDWRNVRGFVRTELTTLRVENQSFALEPLTMTLQEGRVTTSGLVLSVEDTTFRAEGEADLVRRTVRAHAGGHLELGALSPFIDAFTLSGPAEMDVDVNGPLFDPSVDGTVTVTDARLRVRDMPIVITDVKARLLLDETSIRVAEASALLGGGTIALSGGGALQGLRLRDLNLSIAARGVAVRYPVGGTTGSRLWSELKARADAELTLTGRPGSFQLAGTVDADRALYDSDIFLEEAFLPPQVPPEAGEPSRLRRAVALSITFNLKNPLVVRNNVAELQADGSLQVRGDLAEPAPFGRLEMHEGGRVFLQGREFTITSGSFVYQGTMDPEIHVVATTVVSHPDGDVEVTVSANGNLREPRLSLTSVPPYSEKELASLIVTGRPDVTLDASTVVLGRHAAALLAGRFTRTVARQLMSLGFDQVDIQPDLLAREGNPSARFVFGKQVSPNLRLIYAVGLNDAEARYYQAQFRFRPGREVNLKAQHAENGSYTYSVGQRLRLGKGGQQVRFEEQKTRLSAVRFADETPVPEKELLSWVKARPGKRVTYWNLVDDSDRVQKKLVEMGYIEALVDAHLHEDVAEFHVVTGPRYRWRVEAMPNPPDLRDEIRKALYEEEAFERGREVLLQELRKRGYLRADVRTATSREGTWRTLVFTAEPGPLLHLASVTFPGATAFSPGRLIEAAGGAATMMAEPQEAVARVKQLYREDHYLTTKVQPPDVVETAGQVRVAMAIEEGPQAVVSEVKVEGSTLPPVELSEMLTLETGQRYDPLDAADVVLRLRLRYLELGYPNVRVSTRVTPLGPDLQIVFRVSEGQRAVVGDVVVKGLQRTRESLVRRQVDLKPGDPLDPRRLADLERRLLDLGTFSRAVVTASDGSPATITIDVTEQPRYLVAYDARYNQEEGASGLVDAQRDNLFGKGWSIGGRYRRGRDIEEERASFHVPSLFRGGDLTLSAFQLRDDLVTAQDRRISQEFGLPPAGGRVHQRGFEVQQALHFLHPWDLLYGYKYRRVLTQPPLSDVWTGQDVGGINVGAVLDTRDAALVSTARGMFLGANVELAPKVLGSDFDFLKGFTHVSITLPFSRSFYWAQGYRLGLGQTLGTDGRLPSFERFTAGGANSVRGYATDSLGPLDELFQRGGDAVVVFNQELRYMLPMGLGAAVFYDAGNVFESLSDFDFNLRHSIGVGVRYDSPLGLIRVDLGVPLNRRPEDKSYQIWFSLGNAF
jgi:translocation and assembly module TamA